MALVMSRAYPFFICDVFSRERFGGNQLAVLPDALGLDSRTMQQIAREFNFSETTFVLPAEQGNTRKVRIFTPAREVPFAGHPNIGTAFVLAGTGELGEIQNELTVTFEEKAGLVPVTISKADDGALRCELLAPQGLSLGTTVMPEMAAAALSLQVADISMSVHPPRVAGVGLPFLVVELRDREALARAAFNMSVLEDLQARDISPDILLYTLDSGDYDFRARMFAPIDGVPEDPATGSAICALAALRSHHDRAQTTEHRWRIIQGVEMGRPSILEARTFKRNGTVEETRVGGDCVMIASGSLQA
jgi:trans-2,3-dihydro-3-hydroxyanthranilate isomerase